MLIDTHAHLYKDFYPHDLAEAIGKAKEAGVEFVVNTGVDVATSLKAITVETNELKIYGTIGIHPHEANKYASDPEYLIKKDIGELEKIYKQFPEKIVGVGETGLDYYLDSYYKKTPEGNELPTEEVINLQIKLFAAQINLAKKLNLPIIIHCRDDRSQDKENIEAWLKCMDMISGWFGVLHCYSGTEIITKKALNSNFYVSLAGNVTYPKNNYLVDAVKTLPLEKILIETDAPFLSPQNRRGQRNDPSGVRDVAKKISEIKEISFEEVAHQTLENAKKVFKI